MKGVLVKKWVLDVHEEIVCAPTIVSTQDQHVILIGTQQGKLLSIDQKGNVIWTYDAQDSSISSTDKMFLDIEEIFSINTPPVVTSTESDEILIFFGTQDGTLHCVNEQGKKKWTYKTGGPIKGAPNIVQAGPSKIVLVGSHDKQMYFFSTEGKLMNTFVVDEKVETTPIVVDNKIVFGTVEGNTHAYDHEGQRLWTVSTKKKISANITRSTDLNGDDLVFVPSEDNAVYALTKDGEIVWKHSTRGAILTKPTVTQVTPESKEVLVGSADNSVYCLNALNGEQLWSFETDFWVASSPVIDKGEDYTYAIVGSYDNSLYVLDMQGSYELDFIPGLSGVVSQGGFQLTGMSTDAGEDKGKVLSQYRIEGFIVGNELIAPDGEIITVTKKGKIYNLQLR